MNLGHVVRRLSNATVTRVVRGEPTLVNGLAVRPAEVTAELRGVLTSPASPALETLPEGLRLRSRYSLHLTEPLTVSVDGSGVDGDLVVVDGQRYAVVSASNWRTFGFYHYILLAMS